MGPSFSNLLAVKLLKEKGETAAANKMIQEFGKSENPVQKWVVATSNNDQAAISNLEKDFSKEIKFVIMKRPLEVTK